MQALLGCNEAAEPGPSGRHCVDLSRLVRHEIVDAEATGDHARQKPSYFCVYTKTAPFLSCYFRLQIRIPHAKLSRLDCVFFFVVKNT